MRKLTATIILTAAVFACLALFQSPIQPVRSESGAANWISGSLTHKLESQVGSISPRSSLGAYCVDYTFILKTKPIGQPVNYPTINSECAVYTNFGIADGNYLHDRDEKYAGHVPARPSSYHWLPNSGDLIEIRNSGVNKHFRIYPDFIENTQPKNVNHIFNTYQLASNYRPAVNSADLPVNVDTSPLYASSENKWALAYSPNRGSVRVNLETGETLIFATNTKPSAFAVASGGRYAVIYIPQGKKTLLYDLNSCVQVSANVNNPLDCQSRDLTGYISENFGEINKIERFRFLGPDYLEMVINKTESTETEYLTVQLTTAGQFLSQTNSYIAMGDSFASGEGDLDDDWYELGTNEPENKCHLSRRSYPYLINQFLGLDEFHSVACSGAIIEQVKSKIQYPDSPVNTYFVEWLTGRRPQIEYEIGGKRAITISIGGNDAGFAEKLKSCVLSFGTCDYANESTERSQVAEEIANLFDDLVDTYSQVIAKTEGQTKIYAVAYPQFVDAESNSCGQNVHLNQDERELISHATHYINQVIQAASKTAGIGYLDIENSLDGYNLCSGAPQGDMAVNGITFGDDNAILPHWLGPLDELFQLGKESYHPNPNGHQLMAQSILKLSGNNPITFGYCPRGMSEIVCPGSTLIPTPDSYWGQSAITFVDNLNNHSFIPVETVPRRKQIIADSPIISDLIDLSVKNLEPSSEVKIEVHSNPVLLGTFTASSLGILNISVPIPDSVEPGFHTIHVYGYETTGEAVEYYQQILIPGQEGDIDNDGIGDDEDPCGFVPAAYVDEDLDGIDDACDGTILPINQKSGSVQSIASLEQPQTLVGSNGASRVQIERGQTSSSDNNQQKNILSDSDDFVAPAATQANMKDNNTQNIYLSKVVPIWVLGVGLGLICLSIILNRYSKL